MFFGVVEHDRQYKGTCMFLDRHPFIRKHYAGAAVDLHNVMIVIHQLLRLFTRTDRNGLIWIDLI